MGFIPEVGEDPAPDYVWHPATLVAAARLLCRLHDATLDFEPPADACWMLAKPSDLPIEVVCHNDFAPYNTVFAAGRITGVIDWETAAPGARVWDDVAYAAYRFAPLSHAAPTDLQGSAAQARRLAAFCDAYDLGSADRAILLATKSFRRVRRALRDLLIAQAALGDPRFEGPPAPTATPTSTQPTSPT